MKLEAQHFRAIQDLSMGMSADEVIGSCKISKSTLYRWKSDPDFKAALEMELKKTQAAVPEQLQIIANEAFCSIRDAQRELRAYGLGKKNVEYARVMSLLGILKFGARWISLSGFDPALKESAAKLAFRNPTTPTLRKFPRLSKAIRDPRLNRSRSANSAPCRPCTAPTPPKNSPNGSAPTASPAAWRCPKKSTTNSKPASSCCSAHCGKSKASRSGQFMGRGHPCPQATDRCPMALRHPTWKATSPSVPLVAWLHSGKAAAKLPPVRTRMRALVQRWMRASRAAPKSVPRAAALCCPCKRAGRLTPRAQASPTASWSRTGNSR